MTRREQIIEILSKEEKSAQQLSAELIERISVKIKYEGYIKKQEREVSKFRRLESERIPSDMLFRNLSGLRNEAREKFAKFRPVSLGQAGRIEGITSGDIAALSIHIRKHKALQKANH